MVAPLKDLHILPRVRDSLSYLYVEHARIDQDGKSIAIHDAQGVIDVPCAALMLLLLGPGTTLTHAAMRALADNGCLVEWVGEEGVRHYATGMGETRSARHLLRQAYLWSRPELRMAVVLAMYRMRFTEPIPAGYRLQQIRGMEGARVRDAYYRASIETGVLWRGRQMTHNNWGASDPINRALSAAHSCLYGICQSAIIAAGYSTALGFVHTGKQLSFVYDIADLYKADLTIPLAFQVTAEGTESLESRVRHACRDAFRSARLLQRILPDIDRVLSAGAEAAKEDHFDADQATPGGLWDPEVGEVRGGVNWADGEPTEEWVDDPEASPPVADVTDGSADAAPAATEE